MCLQKLFARPYFELDQISEGLVLGDIITFRKFLVIIQNLGSFLLKRGELHLVWHPLFIIFYVWFSTLNYKNVFDVDSKSVNGLLQWFCVWDILRKIELWRLQGFLKNCMFDTYMDINSPISFRYSETNNTNLPSSKCLTIIVNV